MYNQGCISCGMEWNGKYYVPVVAKGGFLDAPGSIYSSILSSFSYYWRFFSTGTFYSKAGTLGSITLSLSCLCLCLFVGQVKSPQLSERSQVSLAILLLGRCQDLKIKRQSVTRSHHSSSFPEQLKSKKR